MYQVLLIIEVLVALALVVTILLQKSEGGALGMGGGGGMMSARGVANLLTRATTVLAITFIGLSLALTIVAKSRVENTSVLDEVIEEPVTDTPSVPDN